MDDGRKHDIAEIKDKLKTATGKEKKQLEHAGSTIAKEQSDSWTRGAREALIDAKKNGKAGDVRQISEDIMKHRDKSGFGKTSFFISLPWK